MKSPDYQNKDEILWVTLGKSCIGEGKVDVKKTKSEKDKLKCMQTLSVF